MQNRNKNHKKLNAFLLIQHMLIYAKYIVPSGKYSIKYGKFLGVKSQIEKYNEDYLTECEFYVNVLKKNGVSEQVILQEDESQCTADNARFTRKIVGEKQIHMDKAIICCKGFHTRRCLMFYQFYFPDTEFIIVPIAGPEGINTTKDNWYKTDIGLKRVLGELSKLGTQFVPEFQQFMKEWD